MQHIVKKPRVKISSSLPSQDHCWIPPLRLLGSSFYLFSPFFQSPLCLPAWFSFATLSSVIVLNLCIATLSYLIVFTLCLHTLSLSLRWAKKKQKIYKRTMFIYAHNLETNRLEVVCPETLFVCHLIK